VAQLTRHAVAQKLGDLNSLNTARLYGEITPGQFLSLYAPAWRTLQEWAEHHDYLVGYEALVDEVKDLTPPDDLSAPSVPYNDDGDAWDDEDDNE
jgi:hypothetical protein